MDILAESPGPGLGEERLCSVVEVAADTFMVPVWQANFSR
jgi:hypothetical protein